MTAAPNQEIFVFAIPEIFCFCHKNFSLLQ